MLLLSLGSDVISARRRLERGGWGGIAHAGALHSLAAQAYFSGPGSSVLIRNVGHGDVQ